MKAISLHQPWATLVAYQEKQYETRSWNPRHRGLLAIHAAKRFDDIQKALCLEDQFRQSLRRAGYGYETRRSLADLPFGAIVCVVNLVDIFPTGQVLDQLSDRELAFGNYGPGRYAWKLELVKRFTNPIPMAGMQSLFDVANDLLMRFQ